MQSVCCRGHKRFIATLDELSQGEREFITRHIIQPLTCRAISLPEAECPCISSAAIRLVVLKWHLGEWTDPARGR
jgi:hypothetical protein